MHYSTALVFVLVIVINLSGKVTLQRPPGRNYGMPPNNPRDETINIGNGAYRNNVVVMEDNPNSAGSDQRGGSQYEEFGNRFGNGNTYRENQPNPRPQLPNQYHHTQVNNNQNPQSSNSDRTQTQGSASYAKNNGRTSFGASQGSGLINVGHGTGNRNQIITNNRPIQPIATNSGGRTIATEASAHNARNNEGISFVAPGVSGVFHVGYGKDNHNQIFNNNRPIQPIAPTNSGGRTIETEANAHNARNNGGTSFVLPGESGVFHVGYGKDNHNQIINNNRPIQPVAPMNNNGRTLQTQGSAYNARNNEGISFVSPDVTGIINVGHGKDNDNQIFVNSRPSQRTTPVNGDRRHTQTQSGKASNNDGYESRANINTVYVNGKPIQPDHNDGTWSTYYTNDQRIKVLNTGRAQSEIKLRILHGILAQILQIKSQLKQEAESLNIKV